MRPRRRHLESDLSWDQSEAVLVCGIAQLPVPADEGNLIDLGKPESGGQVETVVGPKRVIDRGALRVVKNLSSNRVEIDPGPERFQFPQSALQLRAGYAAALVDPRQCGHRLDPGENARCHGARTPEGLACDVTRGLVDEKLD